MDEETKAAFSAEFAALCRKFDVCICSRTNDRIEITRVVKRVWQKGKCPREETLFVCDEVNEQGIF